MDNSWFLVKYVPDLWRNEPVNVGVVASRGEQWAAKYVGQRVDGTIDGRRLARGIPADTYREWVRFINKAAERGTLERRIQRLESRGGDSFIIERRGPLLAESETGLDAAVNDLFVSLVDQPANPVAASVEEAAETLAQSLTVSLERDVVIPVDDHGTTHKVRFDYRYQNGKTTLIERIGMGGHGRQIERGVNDLLWRIGLAEKANVHDFLVLYVNPYSDHNDDRERELRRIEHYANTVDLADPDSYTEVATALNVDLVPDWRVRAAFS